MQPSTYVPSFYFYKLADAISASYTRLNAYSSGAIDANGNIIKPESSIDPFEYLVIKLKKIFEELPYGSTKAKLSNYLSTLQMFGEAFEPYDISKEQFAGILEGVLIQKTNNEISYFELLEDMGVGGGAGALGTPAQGGNINQGGVSGFDVKMKMPMGRRKAPSYSNDCEIFEVDPSDFVAFSTADCWSKIPDSENKRYIQRFQRRNKNAKVGVRSINPVSGEQDLFWITYPSQNFLGEQNGDPLETLTNNVLNPPKKDENIKGAKTERLGRLVLGAESVRKALRSGSQTLLRTVQDKLQSIADKPISNNVTDAYSLNDKTGEMVPYDVKGHTTSLGGRVDVQDYSSHPGLQDVMGEIRDTMTQRDINPERLEQIKARTRRGLSSLSQQRTQMLRDVAAENLGSHDLAVLPAESQSSKPKPFRFPFRPSLVGLDQVKNLIQQSTARYGLETKPGRAEVKIRTGPDFSTQGAQQIFAQNRDSGQIQSAEMHPDSVELILQRVSPKIKDVMRQVLQNFVQK